jgi:outer membrane biosynthesis protein TonB
MSETPIERHIRIEIERQLRQQAPPEPTSSASSKGRGFWRLSKFLLGALLICSGLLSAAMLWVVFGSSLELRRGVPDAAGLRAEARNDASLSRRYTANSTAPSQPDMAPVTEPPLPSVLPPARAAEQQKPAEQPTAEAQAEAKQPQPMKIEPQPAQAQAQPMQAQPQPVQAQPQPVQAHVQPVQGQLQPVRTEPAERDSALGAQEKQGTAADERHGMQCNISLCAATYKSFNEADCSYQPLGGGPRNICALHTQTAAAPPQHQAIVADPNADAADKRLPAPVAPDTKLGASDRSGSQCNRALCAATYRSFNAADCTYQPLGGESREVCELSKESTADTRQQKLRAAAAGKDSTSEPDDKPMMGAKAPEDAESAASDPAGHQCNRALCAATYRSFHAADCSYQPESGGPRRICER